MGPATSLGESLNAEDTLIFGSYYFAWPYFAQAPDINPDELIRHFWRLPEKTVTFDNDGEDETVTFDIGL